jgi:hypothetical protein
MTYDKRSHATVQATYARASSVMSDLKRGYLAGGGFSAADRAEAMGEAPKKKRKRGA